MLFASNFVLNKYCQTHTDRGTEAQRHRDTETQRHRDTHVADRDACSCAGDVSQTVFQSSPLRTSLVMSPLATTRLISLAAFFLCLAVCSLREERRCPSPPSVSWPALATLSRAFHLAAAPRHHSRRCNAQSSRGLPPLHGSR